jgi:DNA-binding transcriptional MerR regulator
MMGDNPKPNGMYIGVLARESGVPVKTIRYYEDMRLLEPPSRTTSGYRIYSRMGTLEKLKFIKKAKSFGFSLSEIREIIKRSKRGTSSCCAYVEKKLRVKLSELETRIKELQAMKDGLKGIVAAWIPPQKRKKIRFSVCPQIEKYQPKRKKKTLLAIVLIGMMMGVFQAHAHEPVFSLGPETIYKGGLGFETEFEYEEGDTDKEIALHYELLYGITEDWSVTLDIPQILDKKEGVLSSEGLGDIDLRTKYQLYRKDSLGAQDKVALIYGLELPTGDEKDNPPLGSGSYDHLFGLSAGHESITWYYFLTGRYVLNADAGALDKGDRLLFDGAVGLRPWLRSYKSWDLVVLLESSYIYAEKDVKNGAGLSNTGGQELFLGPTFLWSIRNLMVKGGIQFPIWQDLNGSQDKRDFRSQIALEYHF